MTFFQRHLADDEATAQLGQEIAPWLRVGDCVVLEGDLGAGKTALARAILRTLAGDADLEVPSPTFTLVQTYEEARVPVSHFDLYRLSGAEEAEELGLDDALDEGAALIEWPSRLADDVPHDRLEIRLDISGSGGREVHLTGHGNWRDRLARFDALTHFVEGSGWGAAARHPLRGDSSTRSYECLARQKGDSNTSATSAFLMNWPQIKEPIVAEGRTYRQLAGLAENVVPFLAVGAYLKDLGLSVPDVYASDEQNGFLMLEDLGDRVYGDLIKSGFDMDAPYEAATQALARLHAKPAPLTLPIPGRETAGAYTVPQYGLNICLTEIDMLTHWAWPTLKGSSCPDDVRDEFRLIWTDLFATLSGATTLMLRDFHSPNLLWLPDRAGYGRAGIIDHQDAVLAHVTYDVASLAQDARVDIDEAREAYIVESYLRQMPTSLGLDEAEFRRAYAVFGAQRAVRLVGLFIRLAHQDKKPEYLAHHPRVVDYLTRNLAHPELGPVKRWLDQYFGSDFADQIEQIDPSPRTEPIK